LTIADCQLSIAGLPIEAGSHSAQIGNRQLAIGNGLVFRAQVREKDHVADRLLVG
jgi:hypothetical protein